VHSKRTAKLVLSASIEASSESEGSDRFSSQRVCHVVFHPIALTEMWTLNAGLLNVGLKAC
jgi:hypothetical protein